jgi:hypothetical protein
MALETTTIPHVPILRIGKGFQGLNCPIRGYEFTGDDLDDIERAYLETRGAVMIPVKIGHSDDQLMLDGMPAAGWVENVRRIADYLIADLTDVPARISALIQAKVYRNRSVELRARSSSRSSTGHLQRKQV